MRQVTRAPRLPRGGVIGIVSVSAPEAVAEPERFRRGIATIEAEGYRTRTGPSTSRCNGYLSGDERLMAEDLHRLIADPEIAAVICAGGGTNANRLLRHIDSQVIIDNPKIIVGMSNPSVLLNAIYASTGLVTFHGPTVVWNFGEADGLTPRTYAHFWPLITGTGQVKPFPATPNWKWWKRGTARGRLIGGNLASLEGLLGTQWAPDWKGHILFWEDIAKPTNILDRCLTHFRDAGVFDGIAGMIVGELVACDPPAGGQTLEAVLHDVVGDLDFPILCNVDLGHTADKLTLPIGCEAILDSEKNTFSLIEPAVQ